MAVALREPTWLVRTLDDYIDLARRYVSAFSDGKSGERVRREMQDARQRLRRKLLSTPLFDTRAWTHDWQRALRLMWDAYLAQGARPMHIVVAPSA